MTEKIQISIPKEVKKDLDAYIKRHEITRSTFFLIAAFKYLKELEKKETRKKLIEFYTSAEIKSDKLVKSAKKLQAKALNNTISI